MPIECEKLRDAPPAIELCKHCGQPFPNFMRGEVQSTLLRNLGLPYCAVICHRCKKVTGWERP